MHTNDVLTGRRLCVCVESETVFILSSFRNSGSTAQRVHDTSTCGSERVTFSDTAEVVVQWLICTLVMGDAKMPLFQSTF